MTKLPEIIGIAGPNGAGKDNLGDLRFARQNAPKVSLSDILRLEADKRDLSHERRNLSAISAEMNREMGPGALAKLTIQNFELTRLPNQTGLSIASIRHPGEARAIQNAGGIVIWIDADRLVRYKRVQAASRGRVTDMKTFEEFCQEEDREMYPRSDDPFVLNMAGVKEIADIHLTNEFDSKEAFEAYLIDRFEL